MSGSKPPSVLLSTKELATLLNRHRVTVSDLVRRLQIPPVRQSGRFRFYDPSVLPKLRASLRNLTSDHKQTDPSE